MEKALTEHSAHCGDELHWDSIVGLYNLNTVLFGGKA
jgi:hypothetical protein